MFLKGEWDQDIGSIPAFLPTGFYMELEIKISSTLGYCDVVASQ